MQRRRPAEDLLVEIRAVRRAHVLEDHHAALADDPRVLRRREGVLEPDLGLVAAAEDRALVEVVLHPGGVPRRPLDNQPRLAELRRDRAVQAGLLRRRGRIDPLRGTGLAGYAAQVLHPAARDPEQEQEQHGDEPELQRHRGRLDRGESHQSTSKRASTVPMVTWSPADSGWAPLTLAPLTRTPLVEPRSAIVQAPCWPGRISACLRDTLESCRTMSHSRLRPMTAPPGGSAWRLPSLTSTARPARAARSSRS